MNDPVHAPRRAGRHRLFRRFAIACALAYPLSVLLVVLWLRFVGERWWAAVAVMYLPRLGFAIPLPFVLAAAWRWAPRWALALQVVSLYVLLVPLMGFTFSCRTPAAPPGTTIRIVSYNIGKAGGRLSSAIAQVRRFSPDIVAAQALHPGEEPALRAAFEGWRLRVDGQFLLASRFPLREVSLPPPIQYAAGTGGAHYVRYALETPLGPVDLFNVHTTSPREGLDGLRRGRLLDALRSGGLFDRAATEFVEFNAYRRQRQIAGLAGAARASRNAVIIAGDTNLPELSWIYGEHLSSFRDGFDMAGRGFGYTFPASHPWMRIDRVLTNDRLKTLDFQVGGVIAAEHLCVFAEVGASQAAPILPAPSGR